MPKDPDRYDEDYRRSEEITMELATWGRVLLPYVGRSATVQGTVVVKCNRKNEHFTLGLTTTVDHPDPVDLDRQNRTGHTVNRSYSREWLVDGRSQRFKLTGRSGRMRWMDSPRSVMGGDRPIPDR